MEKTKIYASGVENLTDARYFAAWYVDYLGFNLEACLEGRLPIQHFSALKGWLDVEHYVGEFSGLEEGSQILDIANYLGLNTIKVGPFCPAATLENLHGKTIFKEYLFSNDTKLDSLGGLIKKDSAFVDVVIIKGENNCQFHYLEHYFAQNSFFFDFPDLIRNINQGLLSSSMCRGIVVKGGDEEKIGVKSFEELDQIYDVLSTED